MGMSDVMVGICELLWSDEAFREASPGGIMEQLLVPRAKLPATVWSEVGGSSVLTFDTKGPQKVRIHFDFPSDCAGGGNAARDALREVLDRFKGQLPNGQYITLAWWFGNVPSAYAYGSRQYSVACDFYIRYNL